MLITKTRQFVPFDFPARLASRHLNEDEIDQEIQTEGRTNMKYLSKRQIPLMNPK